MLPLRDCGVLRKLSNTLWRCQYRPMISSNFKNYPSFNLLQAASTAARIIARNADSVAEMEKAAAIPKQLNSEWLDDEAGVNKKKPGKGKRKQATTKAKGSTKGRKRAEAKGKGRR